MFHFTTLFDKNYLSRGLVLYESLKENCTEPFELYVLCLDEYTELFFNSNVDKYPNVIALSLSELEEADKDLFACKNDRSLIAYYFTISPCLPLFLLRKYELPHICSMDADILFLSNPKPLFEYLKKFSIIITPHKFSPDLKKLEIYGLFNVSFQIFKNNMIGKTCLKDWRKKCVEWCDDYFDLVNNRFADQKYLDNWPEMFNKELKVLDDDISGLAPWNVNNYEITFFNEAFFSNMERIIFYHFQNFRIINRNWAVTGTQAFNVTITSSVILLYKNYLQKILTHYANNESIKLQSIRDSYSSKIIELIISESIAYYINKQNKLFQINFTYLPEIIRLVAIKLYFITIKIKNAWTSNQ